MELALYFPCVQQILDQAEALRERENLSEHNLGLILSPPHLAPAEFQERLQGILATPLLSRFVYLIYQLAIASLIKTFQIPYTSCQAHGLGLLASLFLAGKIDSGSALTVVLDLLKLDKLTAAGALEEEINKDKIATILNKIISQMDQESFKGEFENPAAFLARLRAEGGVDSSSGPVGISLETSKEILSFDPQDPIVNLAETLARLASLGYDLNLSSWPLWPEEPPAPAGFTVPIGGANLFREPKPQPFISASAPMSAIALDVSSEFAPGAKTSIELESVSLETEIRQLGASDEAAVLATKQALDHLSRQKFSAEEALSHAELKAKLSEILANQRLSLSLLETLFKTGASDSANDYLETLETAPKERRSEKIGERASERISERPSERISERVSGGNGK
jgi:hypothetical protein